MKKIRILTTLITIITGVFLTGTAAFAYTTLEPTIAISTNEEMTIKIETAEGEQYGLYNINGKKDISFAFDEPGEYEYFVSQVITKEEKDKTYDRTKYCMQLFVYDLEGKLECITTISDVITGEKPGEISFENRNKVEETTPSQETSVPNTGDNNDPSAFMLMALGSAAVIVSLSAIYSKQKKRH